MSVEMETSLKEIVKTAIYFLNLRAYQDPEQSQSQSQFNLQTVRTAFKFQLKRENNKEIKKKTLN